MMVILNVRITGQEGASHMYSLVKATRHINNHHARFPKAQSSESKLDSRGLNVAARGYAPYPPEKEAEIQGLLPPAVCLSSRLCSLCFRIYVIFLVKHH